MTGNDPGSRSFIVRRASDSRKSQHPGVNLGLLDAAHMKMITAATAYPAEAGTHLLEGNLAELGVARLAKGADDLLA